MAKSTNKTVPTNADVEAFIDAADAKRQEDARVLRQLMERVSGHPAKMWGPSIVGFGSYHYKYESGREGESMRLGFSPRKTKISIYLMDGAESHPAILARLGNYKTGKSCLYVNKLADIDLDVLEELIAASLQIMNERYPPA